MKIIIFYLFNILVFIPLGICLLLFTAILGMTMGTSGGGFGVALALITAIYLIVNYKWSRKFPNSWIHFFCGILAGLASIALVRFIF